MAKLMSETLEDNNLIFRTILLYEDLNSSPRIKTCPLDIENSSMGKDIVCLLETVSGVESIQPYSDVSLRVIMRMADCLMFRHECFPCDIKITDDVAEKLG